MCSGAGRKTLLLVTVMFVPSAEVKSDAHAAMITFDLCHWPTGPQRRRCSQLPGRRTAPRRRWQVATPPRELSSRQRRATAMQAPGEPEQHLAPAGRAPARVAVLGVGALGDDAIALALAH